MPCALQPAWACWTSVVRKQAGNVEIFEQSESELNDGWSLCLSELEWSCWCSVVASPLHNRCIANALARLTNPAAPGDRAAQGDCSRPQNLSQNTFIEGCATLVWAVGQERQNTTS